MGLDAVRRPRHDALLLHLQPGRHDPDDPTNYYNDANLCDPEYDKLYEQQKVELDPDKRMEIVHEMLTRWASTGVYNALYTYPDLQAYRTDKFEGFLRPARGHGPGAVLELVADATGTSSRCRRAPAPRPARSSSDGGGGSAGPASQR